MARKLNGIELTRYDDLFKTDAEREADQQERVQIVPAEQVFPYARQPYSVDRPSADLVRLMDSIERTGIAEPLIVRPRSEATGAITAPRWWGWIPARSSCGSTVTRTRTFWWWTTTSTGKTCCPARKQRRTS